MVRKETKSPETNVVSKNHLFIMKNKTRKGGVALLKKARKHRAGGRKMEKEKVGREGRDTGRTSAHFHQRDWGVLSASAGRELRSALPAGESAQLWERHVWLHRHSAVVTGSWTHRG